MEPEGELRWVLGRFRPLAGSLLASFVCSTFGAMFGLFVPFALKLVIDEVIPRHQSASFWPLLLALLFSYECKIVLTSIGSYINVTSAQRVALSLRLEVLHRLNQLPPAYHESSSASEATYVCRQPIEEFASFGADSLPTLLRLALMSGFTLTAMFILNPWLSLFVFALLPPFLLARLHYRAKLQSDSELVQLLRSHWNSFLEQHIPAIITVQLLRLEKRQERSAFRLSARVIRAEQGLLKTSLGFSFFTLSAVALATCTVIGYGGWEVLRGGLSIGGLVAFYGYVAQLFEPLSGAAEMYTRTQKAFGSIRQIRSVLLLRSELRDTSDVRPLSIESSWELALNDVEFRYNGRSAALDIPSLRFRDGEQVAIVGESGSGKSTLAKLLVRLYDVNSGAVRIDGRDVRSIALESLRRYTAYVPHDSVLFEGSIEQNLRMGKPDASTDDLDCALRSMRLSSFVAGLPLGLRQILGPKGCQLSSGQRQRLALARMFLQPRRLAILDEATSCLDVSSENFVINNLRRQLDGSTLIVITHRLSTVLQFKRVLVFAGGRIVYDGDPHTSEFRRNVSSHSASSALSS